LNDQILHCISGEECHKDRLDDDHLLTGIVSVGDFVTCSMSCLRC